MSIYSSLKIQVGNATRHNHFTSQRHLSKYQFYITRERVGFYQRDIGVGRFIPTERFKPLSLLFSCELCV